MRYFGQRDRYSCGAIAFLNAFKWMGIATTAKELQSLKDILGTMPYWGTSRRDMARLCKDAGFKRVRQPSIEKIDDELIAGNALIVQTLKPHRSGGHAYLIIRRTKQYFICVNVFRGETVSRVSKKRIGRRYLLDAVVNRVTPLQLGKNLIFYPPKAA